MLEKRAVVMQTIKPICEAFNIKDYDYEIKETAQREVLKIGRASCRERV